MLRHGLSSRAPGRHAGDVRVARGAAHVHGLTSADHRERGFGLSPTRTERSFEVCSRIVGIAVVGRRRLTREARVGPFLTEGRFTRTGSSALVESGGRASGSAQEASVAKRRREPVRDGKVTSRRKVQPPYDARLFGPPERRAHVDGQSSPPRRRHFGLRVPGAFHEAPGDAALAPSMVLTLYERAARARQKCQRCGA
jgi:hypothetical protein